MADRQGSTLSGGHRVWRVRSCGLEHLARGRRCPLVIDLRGLSTNLQSLVRDLNATVKRMDLERVSHDTDKLVLQLQAAVQQLEVVLANLDTGSLNETLATVGRASTELEEALRELKLYPSGFLFGAPPPPAKSVAPGKECCLSSSQREAPQVESAPPTPRLGSAAVGVLKQTRRRASGIGARLRQVRLQLTNQRRPGCLFSCQPSPTDGLKR
jgi:hypothetical protein